MKIIPSNRFILSYQNGIPKEVTVYAQSLLDDFFQYNHKNFDYLLKRVSINCEVGKMICKFRMHLEFNVLTTNTRDYNYIQSVLASVFTGEYVNSYLSVYLDNWKQHQLLSRIDELEETIQEQSKLLNKMTIMLENIWMHPSMPGGEEQKKQALERYNEAK